MLRRRSNLGRCTCRTEALRRLIANQAGRRASADRKKKRMFQMGAEQNVARLENAQLRGPDLLVTLTCNPAWDDIPKTLPKQSPMDRYGIIAHVFRQKLKSLMDFMVNMEYLDLCAAGCAQ
ncbi:unnamed protein product [Onchocerca ochengi]|uniref:Helitron_like_N domain-containing protein n=1 Tax=Onchocerca ochengi TaxID=42157 RepID=A0A182E8V9_ONCOC|nr:unnamed protein product [Onchocerca ochengi]